MTNQGRRLRSPRGDRPTDAIAVWDMLLRQFDTNSDDSMQDVTVALRRLHAMAMVDGQVQNGGFNQLYFNGNGRWIADAIDGFEVAGLHEHAALLREVEAPAAAETPLRGRAREAGTLAAFAATYPDSRLGPFDTRWYGLPDVYPALDAYVQALADQIWDDHTGVLRA